MSDSRSHTHQEQSGKCISVETAILLMALFSAGSDPQLLERATRLALRGPDLIKSYLRNWLESQGIEAKNLPTEVLERPVSRLEVVELVRLPLERGAEMAAMAQIVDIYLFGNDRTAENIVYAFYNGIRFAVVKNREPSKEESKQIWDWTLKVTRASKIGAAHWEELEREGEVYLKDWLNTCKENARKRYETFLTRIERSQAAAANALKFLMTDLFGDEETTELSSNSAPSHTAQS